MGNGTAGSPLISPRQGLAIAGPYATTNDIPTPYSTNLEYLVGSGAPYEVCVVSNGVLVETGSTSVDLSNYYNIPQVDQLIDNTESEIAALQGSLNPDEITQMLDNLSASLADTMTQEDIDALIAQLQQELTAGYVTKDQADQMVQDALAGRMTPDQVQAMIDASLGNIPDTSTYTKDEVDTIVNNLKNELSSSNLRKNVTELFTITPSIDDLQVWLDDDNSGNPQIIIRGECEATNTSDLIITAQQGMGSKLNFIGDSSKVVSGWDSITQTAAFYPVTISEESSTNPTNITIPQEVRSFEVFYFVKPAGSADPLPSYWVDTNNLAHQFSLFDTPISNFCKSSSIQTTTITINNQSVQKGQILEIHFGDDYNSISSIPGSYFCNEFDNSKVLDIRGLSGLIDISNSGYTFDRSDNQTSILMNLPNLTKTGYEWMCYLNQLTYIDLSSMKNLITVNTGFYYACPKLKTVYIGTNTFANLTNPTAAYLFGGSGLTNTADVTLIADDEASADAFKTKMSSKASNWTVQIKGAV